MLAENRVAFVVGLPFGALIRIRRFRRFQFAWAARTRFSRASGPLRTPEIEFAHLETPPVPTSAAAPYRTKKSSQLHTAPNVWRVPSSPRFISPPSRQPPAP